jgi:hypothetical protein
MRRATGRRLAADADHGSRPAAPAVYDAADRHGARRPATEDLMTDPTITTSAEIAPHADGAAAEAPEAVVVVAEASGEHPAHPDDGHPGHGHDEAEPLGPADWGAWAGGILGVAAGLLVAACLWLSSSGL